MAQRCDYEIEMPDEEIRQNRERLTFLDDCPSYSRKVPHNALNKEIETFQKGPSSYNQKEVKK